MAARSASGRLGGLTEPQAGDAPEEVGLAEVHGVRADLGALLQQLEGGLGFAGDAGDPGAEERHADLVGVPQSSGPGQRLVGKGAAALLVASEAARRATGSRARRSPRRGRRLRAPRRALPRSGRSPLPGGSIRVRRSPGSPARTATAGDRRRVSTRGSPRRASSHRRSGCRSSRPCRPRRGARRERRPKARRACSSAASVQ